MANKLYWLKIYKNDKDFFYFFLQTYFQLFVLFILNNYISFLQTVKILNSFLESQVANKYVLYKINAIERIHKFF